MPLSFFEINKSILFLNLFIFCNVPSFDLPSIEAKDIAYLYEDLGIEITHRKVKDEENVVFALKQ